MPPKPNHLLGVKPPEEKLPEKPYSFVSLPETFQTKEPIWHDGTGTENRLSGEIRCEIKNLTPLLVGWERQQVGNPKSSDVWPIPFSNERTEQGTKVVDIQLDKSYTVKVGKSLLCPLRAPLKDRPVLIPGDSIKGLLRHELGALLGAPMERVAERSYSYRPNLKFPLDPDGRFLVPRLARVPKDGVQPKALDDKHQVRVPTKLELFPATLQYNKKAQEFDYLFDEVGGSPYRGGQGAGQQLNSKPWVHHSLTIIPTVKTEAADVPQAAQDGYLATLRHLTDTKHGQFCEQRHPDVGEHKVISADDARNRILQAASQEVFQPGDLIWVEWDTSKNEIVSFGWHYYYRWAYQDTVRTVFDRSKGQRVGRDGLFPLEGETRKEKGKEKRDAPEMLSAVRRLFGYTGDNDGCAGIGKGNYSQLMGRISVNAAIEVIAPGKEKKEDRFEEPIFLKELGQPKPSAVENYLKQPYYPKTRPSDDAKLVTYGDADSTRYDQPGQLAGRKFYLDRADAYPPYQDHEPWKDARAANRLNERSTLALEVSKPEHRFRFTLRFRDLDEDELAAVLLALCPDQFARTVGGTHKEGYCSKLGYGRPLGLGTVCIEAKELHFLEHDAIGNPTLRHEGSLSSWFGKCWTSAKLPRLSEWLNVHRQKHPDAKDYQRDPTDKEIYTVHTKLRAEHSRARRYK